MTWKSHFRIFNSVFCIYGRFSHLSEQEGDGGEGKGPAILVGKIGLAALSPVQHFIINTGDVQHQAHHQSQTWEVKKKKKLVSDIKKNNSNKERMYKCGKTTAYRSTWEDEEDPRDKRQDSAVRPDVADVVEDEADEHEEEADQRERSGWADHLWEEAESRCLTIKVQNNSLKKDSFRCNISVVSSQLYGDVTGLSGGMWGGAIKLEMKMKQTLYCCVRFCQICL